MNPYTAGGFQDGFFRTLGFLEQRSQQQRQNQLQDQDRALALDDRSRNLARQDRLDAEGEQDRAQGRQLRGVQIASAQRALDSAPTPEEAAQQRKVEADTQQRQLDNMPTPQEAKESRKLSLDAGRQSVASAQEDLVEKRATRQQKQALPVIQEVSSLLQTNPDAVTDDDIKRFQNAWKSGFNVDISHVISPQFGQAEQSLRDAVRTGRLNDPSTLPAWNEVFKTALNRTSGEQLDSDIQRPNGMGGTITVPKGSTILNRDLVGVKPSDDGKMVYPILRVGYKTPDGQEGTYLAPATEGRKAGDDAHPMGISLDDSLRQLTGMSTLRQALVSNPKALDVIKARTAALAASQAPGTKTNSGALGTDLDYLAKNYTGGDKQKAIDLYQQLRRSAAKPVNERYELTKALLTSSGRVPKKEDVEKLMSLVGPGGAGDAAPAGAPGGAGGAGGEDDFSSLWGGGGSQ